MARAAASPLLPKIRMALAKIGDPARAKQMQAYMKSAMPYHGVPSAAMRAVARDVFATYPFADARSWRADVVAIWRGATHREERYAALALVNHRKATPFNDLDALPMYEDLIVTGAWWDYVDDLAGHRVGELFAKHRKEMKKEMLVWSVCDDMWKRRTSILCQMFLRDETDLPFLYKCIEPSLSSKEFFLRKAIGWALRQVAWYDPDEVVRYVKAHDAELSGLSKREALKNVAKLQSGALKRRR